MALDSARFPFWCLCWFESTNLMVLQAGNVATGEIETKAADA
jgi:hypothetical protein